MVDMILDPDTTTADLEAAERTARVLRERSGQRGTWMEVRSLMSEFEIDRLSARARERMAVALAAVGLSADPPLSEVTRRDTVVLSWTFADSSQGVVPVVARPPLTELLTVRVAQPGGSLQEVESSVPVSTGVRWIDVRETSKVDVDEFLELANPICGSQLSRDMVVDLLTPDPRPKVTEYYDGAVRGSSAFRVTVEESDDGAAPNSLSKAGVLVFEPVEMIVAEDWIISCWHDAEVFRGADRIGERPQQNPANLAHEVDRCWRARSLQTGGDIATVLLYELSLSFKPAVRELQMREEEWELDYFRRPERLDRHTLLETHAEATVLRDWLIPLNRPGMRRDAERAWFPAITGTREGGGWERALGAADRIAAALKTLGEFGPRLRGAYDLLHLRQSEWERGRDEKFQRGIALGGAAILIPTLVAGVMGANTWVPGEYGPRSSHWPFVVLLALVVVSAVAAWALLARVQKRQRDQVSQASRPGARRRTRVESER